MFFEKENCKLKFLDLGDSLVDKCSFITPVPGGVGPMTITLLMNNTLKAFKNHLEK